jgi:hypothetical protein
MEPYEGEETLCLAEIAYSQCRQAAEIGCYELASEPHRLRLRQLQHVPKVNTRAPVRDEDEAAAAHERVATRLKSWAHLQTTRVKGVYFDLPQA